MPPKNKLIDSNPQIFARTLTESAANTYTLSAGIRTPVVLGQRSGDHLAMEILKGWFGANAHSGGDGDGVVLQVLENSASALLANSHPDVIMMFQDDTQLLTSGVENYILNPLGNVIFDFTDGMGNGVLMAQEEIFFAVQGISLAAARIAYFFFLYRLTIIDAEDLVGITRR